MNEKIFEFYGLDFKTVIGGLMLFLLALTAVVAGIAQLFGIDFFSSPAFIACITALVLFGVFKVYGAYRRKLWRVVVSDGEQIEISFGGKLRNRFALSELEKIHLNGWFSDAPKNSYRWLRLTTQRDRLTIIIGNTNLINTAKRRREFESFDKFFALLENYAISRDYEKTDLKRSYHLAIAKHYYYHKSL